MTYEWIKQELKMNLADTDENDFDTTEFLSMLIVAVERMIAGEDDLK